MDDGLIELDSDFGREVGFTSDRFRDSWLCKEGNRIIISMILSRHPGKGNFSQLVSNLLARKFEVAVPTPLGRMGDILRKWNFRQIKEWSEEYGDMIELWVKTDAAPTQGT